MLKLAFTSFLVLCHYDFQLSCTMETDASDFAISAVLSQDDEQGHLHPIVFYSCQLLPAEINYNVGDKEFLAIVEGFKHFRHYAISVPAASLVTYSWIIKNWNISLCYPNSHIVNFVGLNPG
jgi:hypothetical protein